MLTVGSLTKIISVYELPPIETPDDHVFGSLRFSIQICLNPNGQFVPRVLRKERIHAVPAYYEHRDGLVDKTVVEVDVLDDSVEWDSFECASEKDALDKALEELSTIFQPSAH